MKKIIVALVLVSGFTAIAFAAFDSSAKTNNTKSEKKAETKKKKECSHTCMYNSI